MDELGAGDRKMLSAALLLPALLLCASGDPNPTGAPDCSTCGGNIKVLSGSPGSLASPGYPNSNYPNNCNCQWTITAPAGFAVSIRFLSNFETEGGYDYVRVYDGNTDGTILDTCTGDDSCASVYALSGTMTVVFSSDESNTFTGFGAIVAAATPTTSSTTTTTTTTAPTCNCGGTLYVNMTSEAYPQSPGWPSANYPNSCTCTWTVIASAGEVVSISFEHPFYLEGNYDFVHLYDGPSTNAVEIEECTGDQECNPVYSSGQQMTIQFTSDDSGNYLGFGAIAIGATATTTTTTTAAPCICGGNIFVNSTQEAYPQSPGWPSNNYLNNCQCTWNIMAGPGEVVSISFEHPFSLEDGYDYVTIYDGPSTSYPQLEQCSGDGDFNPCNPVYSSGQEMTLTFTSNAVVTAIGFGSIVIGAMATTTPTTTTAAPLCTQTFFVSPGQPALFQSPFYPNNYPNNVQCQWTFIASSSSDEEFGLAEDPDFFGNASSDAVLNLFFSSFNTEACCDSVRVYDGYNTDYNEIRFCAGDHCDPVRSSGPALTVTFQSDESDTFSGFQGNVSLFDPCNCNRTFNLNPSGDPTPFNSPLYPNAVYPPSCSCVWTLVAPDGLKASVDFQNFTIQSAMEYVNVYEGSVGGRLLAKCTGSSCDSITSVTGTSLAVAFRSSSNVNSNQGLGFAANGFASAYVCSGAGTTSLGNCQSSYQLCERAGAGVRLGYCPQGLGFQNGVCTNC